MNAWRYMGHTPYFRMGIHVLKPATARKLNSVAAPGPGRAGWRSGMPGRLGAAAAIGDDRIQRETTGRVVPDAFTHGTSAERVSWFRRVFVSGSIGQCQTFD